MVRRVAERLVGARLRAGLRSRARVLPVRAGAGRPLAALRRRPGQRLRGRPQGRPAGPAAAHAPAAARRRAAGDGGQPRVLARPVRDQPRPSGLVDAADRSFRLKSAVQEIARQRDLLATFMAKPFNDEGGSGFHVHVSLNDEAGRNVFGDPGGPDGLSAVGRHAIGGVLAHAPALSALLNPTINSYKRFGPDTLAPWLIDWGLDNRSAMVRVPPERGLRRADGGPAGRRHRQPLPGHGRRRRGRLPGHRGQDRAGGQARGVRLRPGPGADPADAARRRAGRAGGRHASSPTSSAATSSPRSWPTSATRSSGSSATSPTGNSASTPTTYEAAARSASQTRCGVAGMSMCRTPRWATASMIAFCTAGVEPIVPASPMPLAPSGL